MPSIDQPIFGIGSTPLAFAVTFCMNAFMATALALAATTVGMPRPHVAATADPPPGQRTIWVLRTDNKLVMYDATLSRRGDEITLPAGARNHPESISISSRGDVLFAIASDGGTANRRWWSSDPRRPELIGQAWDKAPRDGDGSLPTTPNLIFRTDGGLFWFEHRERRWNRGDDILRDARFVAWTTDLDGKKATTAAELTFSTCLCETGVCEETCPQAELWAPSRGVTDFFFVTRWVPGQLGSSFQETTLYRSSAGTWTPRKLPRAVEQMLDAADHGSIHIEAVADSGCCGWANESNDTTSVVRGTKSTVIFNERKRFRNVNYDVSFATANAALSPDLSRAAYTIADTMRAGESMRLTANGKPTPDELESLQKVVVDLPRLEIVSLASPDRVAVSHAHTELIGWLDDQRLLAWKNEELQTLDARSGEMTPTGITADAAKFVFLR